MSKALRFILADTALVKNLDNPEYVQILLDGGSTLEERFAKIDSHIVAKQLKVEQKKQERISTDKTFAIACEYAKKDSRIRLAAYDHRGPVKALKEAIADTFGPYLCWVDSDDMVEPTALEETVAVLDAEPAVGVVYTDYRVIDADDAIKGYGRRCRIPYSKDRLLLDFMTFHFRLMRRSVYDQVGGIDDALESAEDYDLCLKLSEITNFKHLAKPLYRYRRHGQSLSQQQRVIQIECSKTAVSKALERRGLADRFELDVEIREKFTLRSKQRP